MTMTYRWRNVYYVMNIYVCYCWNVCLKRIEILEAPQAHIIGLSRDAFTDISLDFPVKQYFL